MTPPHPRRTVGGVSLLKETTMNRAAATSHLVCGVVMLSLLSTGPGACKSAYYGMWDKMGWAKRDILVDRVKDAKEDQEAAKKQFQSALDQFKAVTNFQGGDLEATYKKLNKEYESCESRASDVRKRIASVDTVAQDLFKEWQKELGEYDNAEMKNSSEQKLRDTKDKYNQMYNAMKNAETKMDPVLKTFKTQVLYLKHNLNAAAISSLQTQVVGIQGDVDKLIKDMEASINEANSFISQMK
jgi:chromosome segregation ATPase